jgi:DNA-binding transcriptional MerR regulator
MTLTVGEVARRIQGPDEDFAVVVDRLRNWTKEGLLKPIGDKNPGTGRARRYSEGSVIDALVLSTLTEALNIPAVEVAKMRDAEKKTVLQLARMAAERFDEIERAGGWCWLAVHRRWPHERLRPGVSPFTVILYETKNIYAPAEPGKAARLERSFEAIDIPNWSTASVVLNLTPLFRHLRGNPTEK